MTYTLLIYFFTFAGFFITAINDSQIDELSNYFKVDVHEEGKIYYVHSKPDRGNGTLERPWNMKQAHHEYKQLVKGGDRLKHLPGTYLGKWKSALMGMPGKPIICEPADYNDPPVFMSDYRAPWQEMKGQTCHIIGGYTWYINFIFKDEYNERVSNIDWYGEPGKERDVKTHDIIYISGASAKRPSGVKLINCMVYDSNGLGVFVSDKAADVEVYGNLIAFNGFESEGRGHGPATYMRGIEGQKLIENNIVFGNHQFGLRAYGQVHGFVFRDNVSFSNGTISEKNKSQPNLFIGGSGKSSVIDNVHCEGNICYHSPDATVNVTRIGFRGTLKSVTLKDEIYIGNVPIRVDKLSPIQLPTDVTYDNVSYELADKVKVVKNRYEKNCAYVTVLNKSGADGINVNLDKVIEKGTKIVIWDAQNFKGKPISEQVYEGRPIFLPLKLTVESQPHGNVTRKYTHTPKEFNCFIIRAADRNNSLIIPN